MIHELKTTQPYFDDIQKGDKTFEVRKNDRLFAVGDFLALNEYEDIPEVGYTRRCMLVRVTYILDSKEYCKDGYVVLGIIPCAVRTPNNCFGRDIDLGRYGIVPIYGERSDK